jgi:hypothetical protein
MEEKFTQAIYSHSQANLQTFNAGESASISLRDNSASANASKDDFLKNPTSLNINKK